MKNCFCCFRGIGGGSGSRAFSNGGGEVSRSLVIRANFPQTQKSQLTIPKNWWNMTKNSYRTIVKAYYFY